MERIQNSSELRKSFHAMDLSHSYDVPTTFGKYVESSKTKRAYDFCTSIPLYFNFTSPSEINFSLHNFQNSDCTITNSESVQIKTSAIEDMFYEQGRSLGSPTISDKTIVNSTESGSSRVTVINNNVNNNAEVSKPYVSKPESSERGESPSEVAKAESLKSTRVFNKYRKTDARRRPRSISLISYKSPLQTICERDSCEKMEEIVTNYNTSPPKKIPENAKITKCRGINPQDSPLSRQLKRSDEKAEGVKSPGSDELSLLDLGYSDDVPVIYESKFNHPLKECMLDIICNKIMNNLHTNFVVHIGEEHFHCHHLVLGSYTRHFDDDMINMEATIPEDKISMATFMSIYDWMTFEDNQNRLLTTQNILQIFQASKYLKISDLEEQCWFFVDQELIFSEHTAFNLYLEAMQLNEYEIADLMLQRISKIFLTLVASEDFLNLQVQEVCPLLRSNYAVVNSEMEVLLSAVRWLMHDWDTRKAHDLEVMSCIRFGSINPQYLVFIKYSSEFSELMEIMKNPEIDQLRSEGLAVSIYTYWPHDDLYSHDYLRNQPEARIIENESDSDLPLHNSYKDFLIYLEKVRTSTMFNIPISELDENKC